MYWRIFSQLENNTFRNKFGVEILETFAEQWNRHKDDGSVEIDGDSIRLTKEGLLRVDGLLPVFFEPEFQGVRYT